MINTDQINERNKHDITYCMVLQNHQYTLLWDQFELEYNTHIYMTICCILTSVRVVTDASVWGLNPEIFQRSQSDFQNLTKTL